MIEAEFRNALKGIVVFVVGINIVGLAMIYNGSNASVNPAWEFVEKFWFIQKAFAAILLLLAMFLLIGVVISELCTSLKRPQGRIATKNLLNNSSEPTLSEQKVCEASLEQAPAPTAKPSEPMRMTAAELKRKALKQITGKGFQ